MGTSAVPGGWSKCLSIRIEKTPLQSGEFFVVISYAQNGWLYELQPLDHRKFKGAEYDH
jgi:hypothetical protein